MNRLVGKKEDKKIAAPPISQFSGYYEFLSIDFPCWVYYQGFVYPSISIAFQAARTNDMLLRRKISQVTDQSAFRQLIVSIQNTPDWNERRLNVMMKLNRDKFKRNKDLGLKLFATQSRALVNCYEKGGDAEAFWGLIPRNGSYDGLNTLGKILTEVRQQMRKGTDFVNWVNDQNLQKDEALWPQASLIVQKQGDQVDNLVLAKKNAFLFGNNDANNFKLEHGSISKFHAAIYFSQDMQLVLVDLNSSNGTIIVRGQVQIKLQPLRPESLENRDVIKFGMSSRRYTLYFSYEEVEKRMQLKQRQAKQQLERIEKLKKLERQTFQNQEKQRQAIKSLLELKEYACLYVQNINRNFSYKDIKETFNQYGPVKNVRINIDQKTGKFMGSVLVYYEQRIKINQILENISKDPLKYEFRIVAVNQEQADKIVATFTNKERQQERKKKLEEEKKRQNESMVQRRRQDRDRESRSRSRQRRKSRSDSSSSSSSSSSSESDTKRRRKRS